MAASDTVCLTTSPPIVLLEARNTRQHGPPLVTQRQHSSSSTSEADPAASRAMLETGYPEANRPHAYSSSSSRNTQTSASARPDSHGTQREVRTLPPWIDSFEDGDGGSTRIVSSPARAHAAQHNYAPSYTARRISQDGYVDTFEDESHGMNEKKQDTGFFGSHREPVKGRKWDHARQGDPVIMQSGVLTTSSPWRTYVRASMYGPGLTEDGKRVDDDFLRLQTPGYEKPWRGDVEGNDDPETLSGLLNSSKRRRSFLNRIQHILLMHPLVPLVFRVTVLTTSTIALALSGSVHHLSKEYFYSQNPSTTMALVVDVVAIPYIVYITWDEYTGKPLGLRSPKAKIRLVLLDLFFIIFESANLSLAFAALADDTGACNARVNGYNQVICARVKALCGILMVALIAWSLTFSVSIFRLVERVGGREGSQQ